MPAKKKDLLQTSPACKKSRYQNRYAQPDVSAAFVDHAFQLLPFEENITGKKEKVNSTFPHF